MPDSVDKLDETGLSVKSYSDIIEELKVKFWHIYGDNLNLESNTQDGQMIGFMAQSGTDVRELIQNAWNDLFVDTAQGMALDRLLSLLNISREKGKKARIEATIEIDKEVTLKGVYDEINSQDTVFRINDGKGNDFVLERTETFKEGIRKAYFEALDSGYIFVEPNTVTNIVTSVPGVKSVSNEGEAIENGSDFEDDTKFRYRGKLGNPNGNNIGSKELIEAAILAVDGVESVIIGEGDGSINIVAKGGDREKIDAAIYRTKAAGIKADFKFAEPQPLHYKLKVKDKDGMESRIDKNAISRIIASNTFDINQGVSQLQIAEKVFENFRNLIITESRLSTSEEEVISDEDWAEYVTPDSNCYFVIDKITINNTNKG